MKQQLPLPRVLFSALPLWVLEEATVFDPIGPCYKMSPHPPCKSILCSGSRLTRRPGKCSLGFQQTPWEPGVTFPLAAPTPGPHLQTLAHFSDKDKGTEPSLRAGWSSSASPSGGPAPPGDVGVQPALTPQGHGRPSYPSFGVSAAVHRRAVCSVVSRSWTRGCAGSGGPSCIVPSAEA